MMELTEVMEVMKDEVMMEALQVPDDEDAADGARGHSLSGINPSPSAPADVTAGSPIAAQGDPALCGIDRP